MVSDLHLTFKSALCSFTARVSHAHPSSVGGSDLLLRCYGKKLKLLCCENLTEDDSSILTTFHGCDKVTWFALVYCFTTCIQYTIKLNDEHSSHCGNCTHDS